MASKALSGLSGTKENREDQGSENSITSGGGKAGDTPTKEGFMARYDGPNDHVSLLEFYFGHPTSTKKNHGPPSHSAW